MVIVVLCVEFEFFLEDDVFYGDFIIEVLEIGGVVGVM